MPPPGFVADAAKILAHWRSNGIPIPAPRTWAAQLDDTLVSPKWLVSELTGIPVAAFHTDDARRYLAAIGVRVLRV
jgi:hypothetical protein